MNIKILTGGQPTMLTLSLEAKKPVIVNFTGFSAIKNHSFFNRDSMEFSGLQHFQFPMPLTPDKLYISINKLAGKGKVKLLQTKVKPLPYELPAHLRDYEKELRFFESFAQKAAFLSKGVYAPAYEDKSAENLMLVYAPTITNKTTGEYINQPARVEMKTGVIEASKKHFQKYTVPMIVFILIHEFAHFEFETYNEQIADSKAYDFYKALGYPDTEAMYALKRLMADALDDSSLSEEKSQHMFEAFSARLAALNQYILGQYQKP